MTYMNDQSRVFTPESKCRGQCLLKSSNNNCPDCTSTTKPTDPSELRQVLQRVQASLPRFERSRSGKATKVNIIAKSNKRQVRRPGSSGSSKPTVSANAQRKPTAITATRDMSKSNGQQLSLFPRTDSKLPPVTYKVTKAPGDRARIVLVGKGAQGPDPPVKEVRRGLGVVKGHQHAQSEHLNTFTVTDEQLRQSVAVKHEYSHSDPSINHKRETSADLRELLLPVCYSPSGEVYDHQITESREEMQSENLSVVEDESRALLSPVPEAGDESMLHRPRPIARPVRRLANTPELNDIDENMKSYFQSSSPQYRSSPQPTPPRPTLGARSATQPMTNQSQPDQRPLPPPRATSAEPPATQHSHLDEDGHVRKDSLEPAPSSFHSEDFVRMVCALRDIDRTCLPLFNQCEILQSQRRQAHREIMTLLDQKVLRPSHVSVLRQRQHDLMSLDKKIDKLMTDVMERQRKKMNLVDGLAEVQEIDRKDYMAKMMKENAQRGKGSARRNKELPPPPPGVSRDTVGYAQIIDLLDDV